MHTCTISNLLMYDLTHHSHWILVSECVE